MSKLGASYIAGLVGALVENPGEVVAGKDWSANVQTKDLIYKREDLEHMTDGEVRGVTLHEIGHLLYTPDYHSEYEKAHNTKALHNVYNILEDRRIEERLVKKLGYFAKDALSAINSTEGKTIDCSKLKPYEATLMFSSFAKDKSGVAPSNSDLMGELKERGSSLGIELQRILHDAVGQALDCTSYEDMVGVIDAKIAPLLDLEKDPEPSEQADLFIQKKNPNGWGGSEGRFEDDEVVSYYDSVAVMKPYVSVTALRLAQVLKENSAVRFTGSKKMGKLLSKNTYKVALNEKRIFSKRSQLDATQYNVTLVIDNSGSMSGNKQVSAMRGAVLLEGIAKRLSFPFQTYIYDDSPRKLKDLIQFERSCDGGNKECSMLNRLINDFKKSGQTENNLVIIITDGQGDSRDSMQPYIQTLIDDYDTTLMAIGIGEGAQEAVNSYAPRGMYVPNAEELPSAIISFMRKLIHR